MKKIYMISMAFFMLFSSLTFDSVAQIYEPEGLNMPGAWDAWANPPTNLVLANPNQTAGGLLVKRSNAVSTWSTTIHVAATGGDMAAGTYEWLFTSGPSTNYFANKWAGVTVAFDQLQTYIKEDPTNNSVTLENDNWYTVVWEDLGYQDCRAIFMLTSAAPVEIAGVTEPSGVNANEAVDVDFTLGGTPSAEEYFYIQYSVDDWATSNMVAANITGTNGTASIPGQPESTVVEFNVFSSTVSGIATDGFLYALRMLDNAGQNYTYIVGTPLPDTIGWANLQWPASGEIAPNAEYIVYGRAYINNLTSQADSLTDLQAWIGYNTDDTDPSTWTNWIPAYYNAQIGDNDEYSADLGAMMGAEGTYYYATRFQYQSQEYVYGGYSDAGGNFWDGADYVSGVLSVTNTPPVDTIGWANLQWPANGEIEPNAEFVVYGQAWIDALTAQADSLADLTAWIGYNTEDTDPSTWTNWIPAYYNDQVGDNDEYSADLGALMNNEGTYYYATRFQYQSQDFVYGGFSGAGGDFWDGVDNVSGVLTVTGNPAPDTIGWANLQWPGSGEIGPGDQFIVYGQAWIDAVTNQTDSLVDLEAWIGYNSEDTDPSTWTNWIPAYYHAADGDNDEYTADLGSDMTTDGTFYYATRFKYQDQDYVYGGFSDDGGNFWDGVDNISGVLTVSETIINYPVNFTVTDATGLYSHIKLKGEMTNWSSIAMQQNGAEWTLSLDIYPGSYEWGVLEDDGSLNGIWLVIGDNLVVNVGNAGEITGDTTYTITFVGVDELSNEMSFYPNPVADKLFLMRKDDGDFDVEILDFQARSIETRHFFDSKVELDLSELKSGMYFLRIKEGKHIQMLKFIKQ